MSNEKKKVLIYFNEKLNYHPLAYKIDSAYQNIHSVALEAKEFLDFGLESQKKYKEKRRDAIKVLDYFSEITHKFYTKTLNKKEYDYLLNTKPKKLLKDIKKEKAQGLEEKLDKPTSYF